jgi:3-methyladenine DNA glycosylase AlkD
MDCEEIMKQLKSLGSENLRKIFLKHGIREPMFGVKVEDLKKIQKKVKMDYELAKDLFRTGNADAMYLAGLIADDGKMTRKDLETWVQESVSLNISEYTVPWVASGSPFGFELAMKWIDSKIEHIAASGWSTLGSLVSVKPDKELDLVVLKKLMERVDNSIHSSSNRVRYTMNIFIISVGAYVPFLSKEAIRIAKKMGPVKVYMEGTACKVPDAASYIQKSIDRGSLGKKKTKVKC